MNSDHKEQSFVSKDLKQSFVLNVTENLVTCDVFDSVFLVGIKRTKYYVCKCLLEIQGDAFKFSCITSIPYIVERILIFN